MKRGTLKSRRGSALLIVLGMFSFMLVSAVAFSIYMRASRAPSSYVRRNSVARQLAKAALARAMDEIDCAIGNDPFPGVGFNHDYGASGLNDEDKHKNDNWHGRVFTPSNEVAAAKTVSTLTLEALGYLPPCLIDEVRYWSRHSRTAKWHSFNYGMGQFAFTAVNVSDFFDINQFRNEESGERRPYLNRNSSPHGRISPTYLFRGNFKGNMDSGGAAASAFLNAVADGSGLNMNPPISEVPFVSMMDFNLALGGTALGGIVSPFYNRINGGTGRFYSDENSVRRQVFMAGGWNGTNNTAKASDLETVDLSKLECQPFYGLPNFPGPETGAKLTLYDVVSANNRNFWGKKSGVEGSINIENNFPILTQILLADYLDCDNIPLSLNLPCVEIAPMIVGIDFDNLGFDMKFSIKDDKVDSYYSDTGGKSKNVNHALFQADITAKPEITIQVAFPFKNVKGRTNNTGLKYKVQVAARLFFTPNSENTLRMAHTDNFNLDFLKDGDAKNQGDNIIWPNGAEINEYSILWGSFDSSFTCPDEVLDDEKKYIVDIPLQLPKQQIKRNLFDVWYKDYNNVWPSGTPYYDVGGKLIAQTTDVSYPEGDDGLFRFMNYDKDVLSYVNLNDSIQLRPSLAVWVRIIDPEDGDKVVDMVPSSIKCDSWNNNSIKDLEQVFRREGWSEMWTDSDSDFSKWHIPLIRFFGDASTEFSFSLADIGPRVDTKMPITGSFSPDAYLAGDPRYNWAPEDWYQGGKGQWLDNVKGMFATDCRDDFFMFVSNQGYLQSVYELMFIPRVRQLVPENNVTWGFLTQGQHNYNGAPRMSLADTLHHGMMWRTYRQGQSDLSGNRINYTPGEGWDGYDDLAALNVSSGCEGLRVNPYTDITNIMFGAIANMPCDWMAAGTNFHMTGKEYMNPENGNFNSEYIFDWSCKYDDVYNMAAYWMEMFQHRNVAENLYLKDEWLDIFDSAWDWTRGRLSRSASIVADSKIEDIFNRELALSERKFLYGYLRECFANNSQLFLVFVRAESAAGGGGAGSGARAVALVWRDPAAPKDASGQFIKAAGGTENPQYGKDNGSKYLHTNSGIAEEAWRMNKREYPPHKMRVLFYHQLD